MPVDAKDAMLTAGLNSPTAPPPQQGSNFQAISGVAPGMNYGMFPPANNYNPGEFGRIEGGSTLSKDINEVGGNVAGLYGRDYSPEETKAFIPEAKDPLEEQTNEFLTAYDEGMTATEDSRAEYAAVGAAAGATMGAVGAPIGATIGFLMGDKEGETRAAGTMGAARMARREDRLKDMQARQKASKAMYDDLVEGGMKKGKARRQARRMKREMRKGARATRKEAWKTFKGERDLRRQDEAYKYEQEYSQ